MHIVFFPWLFCSKHNTHHHHPRMKLLIFSLVLVVCIDLSIQNVINPSDEQREELSKLSFRSLPSAYQQALLEVRATSETRDDDITWCCKNGNPAKMKVITTTFIRWEPTGQTQAVVVSHDKCGFGGWSTCTVYGIQHVPTSHIDYGHELVPDLENSQCPGNHVVCCKSMIPVAGFCMTIREFNRVVAEWAKLQVSHPQTTLADLILTLQNNGLPSLSG